MKKIINSILVLMLTAVSCVDKDFDEPPIGGIDPAGLKANTTIAQLKAQFTTPGTVTRIPDTMIVAGIVISSDETGNIYKALVIQDSTGGILIRIDRSGTYAQMPVGRRIFVKCSGLYISDYGELIQIGVLGNGGVDRIPDLLVPQFLIRGQWSQPVPLKVTSDINSLDNVLDQNTLVRLDNVHFDASNAVCKVWSESAASTNRNLIDADGDIIVVRSSNFATFAANFIPGGVGSVVGIFQIFGSTKQFVIRDLKDVINFPPNTCAALLTPVHSIAELQALYALGGSTLVNGSYIDGVVISDKDNLNITANNIVVQDGAVGITVRFFSANTFAIGEQVHIDLSNQMLYSYNGLLQIINSGTSTGIPNANATVTGTGTVAPRITTIPEIIANGEAWESTLVQLSGITISGGTGTYSGSTTLTDGTGNTLTLFTRTSATFASTAYPTTPVTVTAIVSDFSGRQLNLRSAADVQP